MKKIAPFIPWIAMVAVAIFVSSICYEKGASLVKSALAGAFIGVFIVWLICFSSYRLVMFFTRGAPFKLGDSVMITSGDYQGKRGVVTKIVEGRNAVFVAIDADVDCSESEYFEWESIKRSR